MASWSNASLREKSGWIMGALVAVLGGWYFLKIGSTAWQPGGAVPTGLLVRFIVWCIVGSIIVQAILAMEDARAADAPADERELQAALRASHWSGLALGVGAVTSLLMFPAHGDGVVLFHAILASLVLSEVVEQLGTAWLLRRGF